MVTRFRAKKHSVRGASVGNKVCIEKGCRIDFPWCVSIGDRATLEPDVWLKLVADDASLTIGEYSFLGRGTELDVSQSVTIGSHCLIAPRVFITDHTHNIAPGTNIVDQGCESSPVRIGNDVWIGTGATILSGVTIGDGAVVGAGAIVRCDIPANEIWAGVPAKKIRSR